MKKLITACLLILSISISACSTLTREELTEQPKLTVELAPSPTPLPFNQYSNNDFGLSFHFPLEWFGAEEYISDNTLRVEIGSDVVYPYGERPDDASPVTNSYNIIIQYTKNNPTPYVNDTYQILSNLQDGEEFSTERSKIIRIRQVELGQFKGFEYVSTLSDSAQTPPTYSREIILLDDQSNLITIFGTPNNVLVNQGDNWREIYQAIDEENLTIFQNLVDSIKITSN